MKRVMGLFGGIFVGIGGISGPKQQLLTTVEATKCYGPHKTGSVLAYFLELFWNAFPILLLSCQKSLKISWGLCSVNVLKGDLGHVLDRLGGIYAVIF